MRQNCNQGLEILYFLEDNNITAASYTCWGDVATYMFADEQDFNSAWNLLDSNYPKLFKRSNRRDFSIEVDFS